MTDAMLMWAGLFIVMGAAGLSLIFGFVAFSAPRPTSAPPALANMTHRMLITPTPAPTAIPTLTPTPTLQSPARIESGWFGWNDEQPDAIYFREVMRTNGERVIVCSQGQVANSELTGITAHLDKGKCVEARVTNVAPDVLPGRKLAGIVGSDIRERLLGFPSDLDELALLNLSVWQARRALPDGYAIK